MKLAIVGTKNPVEYSVLEEAMKASGYSPREIVSTGEKGVAELASLYAKYNSVKHREMKADWKNLEVPNCKPKLGQYGEFNSMAAANRDEDMINHCDGFLFILPDDGTMFTINKVKKAGKTLFIYNGEIDSDEQVNF